MTELVAQRGSNGCKNPFVNKLSECNYSCGNSFRI